MLNEREIESCYLGQFQGSMIQGKGKYTSAGGKVYEGQWRENKKHG